MTTREKIALHKKMKASSISEFQNNAKKIEQNIKKEAELKSTATKLREDLAKINYYRKRYFAATNGEKADERWGIDTLKEKTHEAEKKD